MNCPSVYESLTIKTNETPCRRIGFFTHLQNLVHPARFVCVWGGVTAPPPLHVEREGGPTGCTRFCKENCKCLTGSLIIKIILGILFEGFLNSIFICFGAQK